MYLISQEYNTITAVHFLMLYLMECKYSEIPHTDANVVLTIPAESRGQ